MREEEVSEEVDYLLGIDIGTTGVKTLLIDVEGNVVAKAVAGYPLYHPHAGWAEQDAEDWWHATVGTIRNVAMESGIDPHDIRGIGLSGQMHSAVLLDASLSVIRRAILWCDVRTTDACQVMTRAVGGRDRLIELTCNPAVEGFTAPKVVWIKMHEPWVYANTAKIILPKDYIRLKLTGQVATEVSDAAGTGFFDVARHRWSQDVLSALDIPETLMPQCYESTEVTGYVTESAAGLTGLCPGIPVVGGGADNACGAVGAGVVRHGRALGSIGTSGVVFVHSDVIMKDPLGRVHTFNHAVRGAWSLLGCVLSAGFSLKWVKDNFGQVEISIQHLTGIDAYDLLSKQAATVAPGSDGLIFLPYLMGERTPHADADARGVLFGITSRHTRAHVLRAVMEGVVYAMSDGLDIIKEMGMEVEELRTIGGGARSQLWRQIQADVMNSRVLVPQYDEGPAYGAALLAGVGSGIYADIQEAADSTVRVADETAPISENVEVYSMYRRLFKGLYPALRDCFKEASELSKGRQDAFVPT